jgi:Uncharacterized protein encoded in hypervariable junctions of pilus gene clusters
MNTIRYKDYISTIEYEEDMEMFHGRVANIRDVVSFYGKSVDELKTEMKKSVDEYISFCEGRGIQPSKRYSGRLNLRTDPKLHGWLATGGRRAWKESERLGPGTVGACDACLVE